MGQRFSPARFCALGQATKTGPAYLLLTIPVRSQVAGAGQSVCLATSLDSGPAAVAALLGSGLGPGQSKGPPRMAFPLPTCPCPIPSFTVSLCALALICLPHPHQPTALWAIGYSLPAQLKGKGWSGLGGYGAIGLGPNDKKAQSV